MALKNFTSEYVMERQPHLQLDKTEYTYKMLKLFDIYFKTCAAAKKELNNELIKLFKEKKS
jgi:hypothetical protein